MDIVRALADIDLNTYKGAIQMETCINIVIGVIVGTLLSWVLTTLGILAIAWCDDK